MSAETVSGKVPHKRLHPLFKWLIRLIFLPTLSAASPRIISRSAGCIIAFGLVVPIVLAEPHVKDWLFCKIFDTPSDAARDRIKKYCDFATLVLQILIAVTLGGVAITEEAG